MRPDETEIGGTGGAFQPTLWTCVLRAGKTSAPDARAAFERLIELYWKPVYFHIRRKGRAVEDAKDLTQGFFARLLEGNVLERADREKGKFRTFLLAVLDHFLCDQYDRERAREPKSRFDFAAAETQYRREHTFERDWALAVLERAFVRLTEADPRAEVIAQVFRKQDVSYVEVARRLQTTEANVKVLVHRARERLRRLLLEELRATVGQPGQEEEELNELFRAFSL